MSRRVLVPLFVLSMLAVHVPARAQNVDSAAPGRIDLSLSAALPSTAVVPPVLVAVEQLPSPIRTIDPVRRSGASPLMTSLYASTVALQALDAHSTFAALDNGAFEANPLMGSASSNKATFLAIKAGVAVSTVLAAKNMAKRNKVAAVLTLVAVNSAYAFVVNHNYRVARAMREARPLP
jgi:hypothetical protein